MEINVYGEFQLFDCIFKTIDLIFIFLVHRRLLSSIILSMVNKKPHETGSVRLFDKFQFKRDFIFIALFP